MGAGAAEQTDKTGVSGDREAADVVFSILCVPPGSDFSCLIITVQERKCKRKFMILKCENVESRKIKKRGLKAE